MNELPELAEGLNAKIITEKLQGRMREFMNRPEFLKEVSFATQIIKKNRYLQKGSSRSALEAIMNVAQTGLTLNPVMRLAYLVPRWDRSQGGSVINLEPSYQGLVKLLTDTGSVKHVYAQAVHENDEFEMLLGSKTEIKHRPNLKGDRGEITHVYGIAELNDGLQHIELMFAEDVKEIRNSSESWKAMEAGKINTCVWKDHYSEMARKTVIRRMVKYLPKTDRWEKISHAVQLDESDWQISDGQFHYAEGLISTSTYDEMNKQDFEMRLAICTRSQYEEMITDLQNNQIDPIQHGKNYSATDITNKLKNEI